MSIYDCDEKGPYPGFIGKRVVVCVAGVVHQHYYGWGMYGSRAGHLAEIKEAELMELQAKYKEERAVDLTPRRVKMGESPSYPIARNIQFITYLESGTWKIGFNINKRKVGGCVRVVINTDFEKSWKRAVERYVEINGIGNLEKELLETYKPQKEQLCNHILKTVPNFRGEDFPTSVLYTRLDKAYKDS